MTRTPRPAAALPNAIIFSGVRWAETTSTSCATSNSLSTREASCITDQSESDPMTTETSGDVDAGIAIMLGAARRRAGPPRGACPGDP